jgi:hypothetical protein
MIRALHETDRLLVIEIGAITVVRWGILRGSAGVARADATVGRQRIADARPPHAITTDAVTVETGMSDRADARLCRAETATTAATDHAAAAIPDTTAPHLAATHPQQSHIAATNVPNTLEVSAA